MSTTGVSLARAGGAGVLRQSTRAYFASDSRRAVQTALGVIWLLDGGLQFQSFMYSKGFIDLLTGLASGQPTWLAGSIDWAAHLAQHDLAVYNTLFALTQVAIGLGLLYRPTVRPALVLSFAWAPIVWWFGEAFGGLLNSTASPLSGAPGAVALYALIGLIVWPSTQPGGLLGARGARVAWAALWLLIACLWLEAPTAAPGAITDAINAAPSGMSWLTQVQDWAADAAQGGGVAISILLAFASAAIGIAVAADWRPRAFLGAAIVLNLAYWVLGQGFGGIFMGGATDPNAGLLFVVLASAMFTVCRPRAVGEDGPHQERGVATTATAA